MESKRLSKKSLERGISSRRLFLELPQYLRPSQTSTDLYGPQTTVRSATWKVGTSVNEYYGERSSRRRDPSVIKATDLLDEDSGASSPSSTAAAALAVGSLAVALL